MSARVLPFEPRRPFVEIERPGISTDTGLPVFHVHYHDPDGGCAFAVWDGGSLAEAMTAARAWEMPVYVNPSARAP